MIKLFCRLSFFILLVTVAQSSLFAQAPPQSGKNLPDGKTLSASPATKLNSFPVALAVSPDGRYVVSLNNGFGTPESGARQSLAVLDRVTNAVTDYPDERLGEKAKQSYFLGLAFSSDGKKLFASFSSITDPEGNSKGSTGNGIAVYSFSAGNILLQGFLKIPLQPLPAKKVAAQINSKLPSGTSIPYPAGIAFIPGKSPEPDRLLVANNLADNALLLNADTGELIHRFDLSNQRIVPGSYPYSAIATRDGKRGYISLWNASQVAELDLDAGKVIRFISVGRSPVPTASGSHPTALLLTPDESRLYVTLANRDSVAVMDTATGKVTGELSTRLPGQNYLGAFPVGLAQSTDGKQLFVSNAGTNSVAIFEISKTPPVTIKPSGFIPTEWYPQALVVRDNELIVASGKGRGTVPNDSHIKSTHGKSFPYILSLLHGSLARIDLSATNQNLKALSAEAIANNHLNRAATNIFPPGKNPIKHVIYIVKENRSYDQVFGDLKGSNGDASLVMYGEDITPNQHKLAREFGILDNFYDSGEVSGDGHNWSTAASASDYLEKTIQIGYRGNERTYDYEGEVANRVPLEDEMPDVNETGTGYIWGNVARHGLTHRHYGEFVATRWCNKKATNASPRQGTPISEGAYCEKSYIYKGEPLPLTLGDSAGKPSPWPWPVPLVAKNVATKPELRGHFDPYFPDFNLEYPDQLRADEFLKEFQQFVKARDTGKGQPLPNYVLLRLGNDHTSGTKAGLATPSAAVADNDLAVGRIVDAISHSAYWNDTAILILEDDAQDGPDHVDAHRSIALAISKYSPASAEKPLVDSNFYNTVSMIRTLEMLLGLPAMNNNDANAVPISSLFAGSAHQAFTADYRNLENGLLYEINRRDSPGAAESAEMDFTHADRADTKKLNAILWQDHLRNKAAVDSGKQ